MKKYLVEIKFEANVEIEAESEDEAREKAWNFAEQTDIDEDFVLMEPKVLEVHE